MTTEDKEKILQEVRLYLEQKGTENVADISIAQILLYTREFQEFCVKNLLINQNTKQSFTTMQGTDMLIFL